MGVKSRTAFFLILFLCQHLQVYCQEAIESSTETHEFQAEIGRLMDIIINSLYTNKEIFLREIISNASDALDKIRFLSIADPAVLKELSELVIRIEYDAEAKTISIYDSGIGMTKQDLINNLGTIAKSGTTNFVQALAQGQSLNLIGQFGVGFYSTFLAGNKVTVITKNNNDDQYIWESSAAHSFSITKDPNGNTLKRGTKIIIDLKQDSYEFCEEKKLKELIEKYSEFINFPIYLRVQKEISKEVADEDAETTEPQEKPEKKDDLEIKDEDEVQKPKTKTVTEKVWDWELINDNKAIWLRDKDEITTEEYNAFYKAISKEFEDPLAHTHFKAEGDVDFKSILFVPGRAPSNLFENYYAKVSTLKLYVRRVLINEKFEDLLPKYLNFVRGVIDSDELPINVSRETLQQVKMLKVMGRKLVKKTLEMLKKLSDAKIDDDEDNEEEDDEEEEEDVQTQQNQTKDETKDEEKEKKRKEKIEKYNRFWNEFGKNIKLGIIEDASNRNKLVQLTRWHTSWNSKELSSLDDYISRMKPNQEYIYYIGGESKDVLLKTPALQALLKKGYEVLLLDDPIDEFCLQNVYDYEKKMLVNVGKGTFVMPTDDETEKKKIKKLKKMYEPLTDWWKNLLKEKLDVVTISERLVDDPCIVVGSVYGQSATMERISKAQAYGPSNPLASSKKNLEVNPSHPVIKELLQRVQNSPDKETEEMATLLYEAALLNSGFSLADPSEFAGRFFKIFNPAMGIAKDAKIEEVEVDLDDVDDEEPTITPVGGTSGEGIKETIDSNSIKIEFDEPKDKKKPDFDL
jgi:heat shock protein beta